MDGLIHMLASNTAAAGLLALLAAGVGRWCRAAALTHVLWLLVLVKLVTPPLISVPLLTRIPDSPSPRATRAPQPLEVTYDAGFAWLETTEAIAPADVPVAAPVSAAADPLDEQRLHANEINWPWWLLAFSGLGTVLYIATAARRALCFSTLVRQGCAPHADDTALATELSQKLGLRRLPRLVSVPARISPAVWPTLRGPVVLLPAELFARLDRPSRRVLIAHEMAHIHRRDYWVRLLEMAITAVCWWHPLVWIARPRLREAEELCCDGWVLRMCRGRAKQYATALVDTLDFLSARSVDLPALASGARPVGPLKRRIEMVMRYQDQRKAAWPLRLAALAAAVLLMSLAPAWAEDVAPAADDTAAAEAVVDVSESIGTEESVGTIAEDYTEFIPVTVGSAGHVIRVLVAQDETATQETGNDAPGDEEFGEGSTDARNALLLFANNAVNAQDDEPGDKAVKSLTITYDDGTTKEIALPEFPKAGAVTVQLNLTDGTVTAMNVQSRRTKVSTSRAGDPTRANIRGLEFHPARPPSANDPNQQDGTRAIRLRSTRGSQQENTRELGYNATRFSDDAGENRDDAADSTEARLNRIEKVLEALQQQLQSDRNNERVSR